VEQKLLSVHGRRLNPPSLLYKEKATIDGNRSWKALKPFNKTLQQEVLLSLAIHTDERSIQGSGIGQFTHKLAIQLKIMEAEGKA
jgi:hypothetical protein